MPSNIFDVAKLAGVSISTVSRVFTNKATVNREVQEKVLACAEELNYYPNYFARGLRNGGSKTIAFIIPNIENPIFPPLMHGVEDYAHERGYGVLVCNSGEDPTVEAGYISSLSCKMVEGFLLTPTDHSAQRIEEMEANNIPLVCVSRGLKDKTISMVGIDNKRAGYEATKYLLSLGHRKIAMLNGEGAFVYELRLDGYKRALEEAGVAYDPELVYLINSVDISECAQRTEEIFSAAPLPDAIFSGSDPKAIGAMNAFKRMGISVPGDISIISIDDLFFSSFMDPPLTTIQVPYYDMGYAAAEMLIDKIENVSRPMLVVKMLPAMMMVRGSTQAVSGH